MLGAFSISAFFKCLSLRGASSAKARGRRGNPLQYSALLQKGTLRCAPRRQAKACLHTYRASSQLRQIPRRVPRPRERHMQLVACGVSIDRLAGMSQPAQHEERVLDRFLLAWIILRHLGIQRMDNVARPTRAHDKYLR